MAAALKGKVVGFKMQEVTESGDAQREEIRVSNKRGG